MKAAVQTKEMGEGVPLALFAEEPSAGRSEVWAVGGGKGGTGKSFVTRSLGACLAARGKRVVLLDADLGGANLHSFLGIKRPDRSLSEFFERKVPLADLVVPSGLPGVGLITGDIQTMESGDVKYTQKLKLFRHMRKLDADYVLVDLGSGAHQNTLDVFLHADKMIVVIMPEVTSIENMYHFVKSVFFRKLKMAFADEGLGDRVSGAWRQRDSRGIRSLRDLAAHLEEASPDALRTVHEQMEGFRINVVLNQVRGYQETPVGDSVRSAVSKVLGFNCDYLGYVEFDDLVQRCINSGRPFIRAHPSSRGARGIEKIADRLLRGWPGGGS